MDTHVGSWNTMQWQDVAKGVKRKVFTGEGVTLCLHLCEPGPEGTPHKHKHEQICYLVKGKAELNVEGKVYNLKEGELLYIPPNVEHSGRTKGNEDALMLDVFSPQRSDYL